ncbi:unnamed protein product [Peniophora sp. CBMAI 1063]|nr:unnamed protein product [Peniophora sp. CBMAI 1063]
MESDDSATDSFNPDTDVLATYLESLTMSDDVLDSPRRLGDFMWARFISQPPDITLLHEAISAAKTALSLHQESSDQVQLLFDLGLRLRARSTLNHSLDDLDEAVRAFQRAIDVSSDEDPRMPELVYRLGLCRFDRFELNDEIHELEDAVTAFCCAVELMSDDHPDKLYALSSYGGSLNTRFERMHEPEDIDRALIAFENALELVPKGSLDRIEFLHAMGDAFETRFELTGEVRDLERAILSQRGVIELMPVDHPLRPTLLTRLGGLLVRLDGAGEPDDIESQAISLYRTIRLTSHDDPTWSSQFLNVIKSLHDRNSSSAEDLDDIEKAIAYYDRLVKSSPDHDPWKITYLRDLGDAFAKRFVRLENFSDLEQAISLFRRAIELSSDDNTFKSLLLMNLGDSLTRRFETTGDIIDVDEAISVHRRALEITPDESNVVKPSRLNNLGDSLVARFLRTGQRDDIDQAVLSHRSAVELSRDEHPRRAHLINSLGNSLFMRFEHFGARGDIDQAISSYRTAVDLTADGHPDKPSWHANLGGSLHRRFEQTGELDDLEQAISFLRRAVKDIPDGHPRKASLVSNLGAAFHTHFQCIGELDDLDHAIAAHLYAIQLTPDEHLKRPMRLNNLAISLARRSDLTENPSDLEQAISAQRCAVDLVSDDHPQKPMYLSNLCLRLHERFQRLQETSDLTTAITAINRAIELDAGHSNLSSHRNNLALCLISRFEHTGQGDDLESAISLLQEAVQTVSTGQSRLSEMLWNLGSAQMRLFEGCQTQAHFDNALESFLKGTVQVTGQPSSRLRSAWRCADMLHENPSFSTADSLMSAHSRIIAILPEVVWLGHGIQRRYKESSQVGNLVNAAVSAAIDANALKQAVEWLEAGRGLIWTQVLSLRTPLDELLNAYPYHAEALRSVQQKLQMSSHDTFIPDTHTFGGISGISVNSAADLHRKAAIDHDKVLKQIRGSPGFEDFLLPKKFDALVLPPDLLSGPIVFINTFSTRSHALILHADGTVASISLPELSSERAISLQSLWAKGLAGYRHRGFNTEPGVLPTEDELELISDVAWALQRHSALVFDDDEVDIFTRVLECIWRWIVGPILQFIDLANLAFANSMPHITWCPTGPLTQLPLHAAGIYSDPLGPRAFDFVVSSYTPSLTAAKRCAEGVVKRQPTPSVLIVTQPATPGLSPLPGTRTEGRCLQNVLDKAHISSSIFEHRKATIASTRAAMDQYPWVHLACHGSQNLKDATQSAFHLYDGPMTLANLMGATTDVAELAFLSACQTAVGDAKTPEESAHLAAGMLAVGYKGVIATMWSIMDADAPVVVDAYYKELLQLRGSGTLGKGETGAAYALHEATRVLREKAGKKEFMRWVPFVHFGV